MGLFVHPSPRVCPLQLCKNYVRMVISLPWNRRIYIYSVGMVYAVHNGTLASFQITWRACRDKSIKNNQHSIYYIFVVCVFLCQCGFMCGLGCLMSEWLSCFRGWGSICFAWQMDISCSRVYVVLLLSMLMCCYVTICIILFGSCLSMWHYFIFEIFCKFFGI